MGLLLYHVVWTLTLSSHFVSLQTNSNHLLFFKRRNNLNEIGEQQTGHPCRPQLSDTKHNIIKLAVT